MGLQGRNRPQGTEIESVLNRLYSWFSGPERVRTQEHTMSQYVTLNYTDATTGEQQQIPVPLSDDAWNALSTTGAVSAGTGVVLNLKTFWEAYTKYAATKAPSDPGAPNDPPAPADDGSSSDWSDSEFFSAEDEGDFMDAFGEAADLSSMADDVADIGEAGAAVADGLDIVAEGTADVAAATAEIPFVDIATAGIAVIVGAAAGLVQMISHIREKNETTMVFINSIPNTSLGIVPVTSHGSWFLSNDSSGNAIAGTDTDDGISDISLVANADTGGMKAFTMEPRGTKCEGTLTVQITDSNTHQMLAQADGSFYNPIAKPTEKSAYYLNKTTGGSGLSYSILKSVRSVKGTTIYDPSSASRRDSLHDLVIWQFVPAP